MNKSERLYHHSVPIDNVSREQVIQAVLGLIEDREYLNHGIRTKIKDA